MSNADRVCSVVAAAFLALCPGFLVAATRVAKEAPSDTQLEVLPVQGNVYLLSGAGGNIAVQIGSEGILLVDTGEARHADQVIAEIRKLSPRDLQIIINTHVHADHAGGNAAITGIGKSIGEYPDFPGALQGADTNFATIYAHENVLSRMSNEKDPNAAPEAGWPTDTFFVSTMDFSYNDEAIQVIHQPHAHTDGDSIVYFRGSNVVVTGDIFDLTRYPVIDEEAGGSIDGIVDALNNVIEITIPLDKQEGGTMVIPGRGRLADEADIVYYRDMVTIVRDRVADAIKRKASLSEVLKSRPTLGFDARFARQDAAAVERFVAAVYRTLAKRNTESMSGLSGAGAP